MARGVLDRLGFVRENEYLVISYPMWQGILAYRILARVNKGFEKLNYGVLPVDPTATGVATGIMLANAYSGAFAWAWAPLPILARRTDMWWFDNKDKLIQARWRISPYVLRNFLFLWTGTQSAQFEGILTADPTVPSDFGYWRGTIELPILPFMHIQMGCYNHTNMNLIADARFEYAEYNAELIRDPNLLFKLMNRIGDRSTREAHWMTYPGEVKIPTDPFSRAYNIVQPIPLSKDLQTVREDVAEYFGGA